MKSKIVNTIVAVLIGVGGFYGGIYYGTIELDMMMDELSTDYILFLHILNQIGKCFIH